MGTQYYIYKEFKSIWKEVDNSNLQRLSNHPQLWAKLNAKDDDEQITPLFLACKRKNYDMVDFLLQCGADPNIECKGITPLYLCCLYGEMEMVDILLKNGANVNVLCTSRKISPLHLAASKGMIDMLEMLLKYNCDVSIHSAKYGNALHVAVNKNHANITRILLSHGINVNALNSEGETPLHIASRCGYVEIVKMLLNQKVNASLKENQEGNTALHLACLYNQETTALLLISKFPDLIYTKNTSERQTPLFYASDSVRKAIKHAFTEKMPGFIHAVNNKQFSDIKFIVGDKTIYAHRCPELLTHKNKEPITEFDHATFLAFLTYLYTDAVQCEASVIPKLMKCADRYKMVRLRKLCLDMTTSHHVDVPPSTFKEDMKHALNNEEFSDVTLLVEGKKIHAHRVILSQHAYFRAMFSAQLKESIQKEVSIDVNYNVFMVLLTYTYTFEMKELAAEIVVEVFMATDQFMIDGLRHGCELCLCGYIAKDNCCALFQLADTYKSLFLREECLDFIIMHFRSLQDTLEFQNMSTELKEEIVQYMEKLKQPSNKPKAPKKDLNFSLL